MIKLLHSADWHLDSPIHGRSPEQTQALRKSLLALPHKIASLCKAEGCQILLLSGDLFDGNYTKESYQALRKALEEVAIPVFIAPGNHDYLCASGPWLTESWPANVHIFTHPTMESVALGELDCRIYGAGFTGMDCAGLLEGFSAKQEETYAIGVLHGDPTQTNSPYCPITARQVQQSNLDYLALGHIHKGDSFRQGKTLCAWPGCPQGRGYDELGEKGVLLVTLDKGATTQFLPLDTLRFYDLEINAPENPKEALFSLLPPVGNENFYRITFTGNCEPPDIPALTKEFSRFPNLELRDQTLPPVDIWRTVGEDSFEGMYFKLLQDALEGQDDDTKKKILLAARISRNILDGQEVVLP